MSNTHPIFYAHTLPNRPSEEWERLDQHEAAVAELAAAFLARIHRDLAPWGSLLGRLHDLGKYSQDFQNYLMAAGSIDVHRSEMSGRVDHSTAAAQHANHVRSPFGKLLAYIFAGHHAGLPDWTVGTGRAGLKERLSKEIPPWKHLANEDLCRLKWPTMLPVTKLARDESATIKTQLASFRIAFLVRMLFSSLVDADFLATERFMSPQRTRDRPNRGSQALQPLCQTLETRLAEFESSSELTLVNQVRKEVSDACLRSASQPPGLFSLDVPTGGGKTLASMRFALAHAIEHDLDGVVVAIPYTSIIEQNAKVYRDLFRTCDPNAVLEHHSSVDPDQETTTSRLQTENWDASLVVTTSNQLFESLFACRTSRCRKLHRIAKRVIILDEVQSLPVEVLKPTLYAIRELVESFGCTVVLCTATQPALEFRDEFPIGLHRVHPIISAQMKLPERLNRTRVERLDAVSDAELSARLLEHDQVLCVINTRPQAAALFETIEQGPGNFHLSTRMCAAHRLDVIENQIKPRLQQNQTCRVVSTQLIEAGVDVDFPVVYRAACGLDSLTQAAGRCNREGRYSIGRVIWFQSESLPPPECLRITAAHGQEIADQFVDPLSPEAMHAYFSLHYWQRSSEWDKYDVLQACDRNPNAMEFQFREIAERYRLIDDSGVSLFVPFGEVNSLIQQLADAAPHPGRNLLRKLGRYSVNVREHELHTLQSAGAISIYHDRYVLNQSHLYDQLAGLRLERADGVLPPEDLIF